MRHQAEQQPSRPHGERDAGREVDGEHAGGEQQHAHDPAPPRREVQRRPDRARVERVGQADRERHTGEPQHRHIMAARLKPASRG
jgi:hypothetical protein